MLRHLIKPNDIKKQLVFTNVEVTEGESAL
jgi:hypothetical protein